MMGQYVRMVVAPTTRMGTVKAARFERGQISFLFHQDSRLDVIFPDIWLLESELEECAPPTDQQLAEINKSMKR